jgi:hypothetical protein
MADIPNTRFINLADTPASISYGQNGETYAPLDAQSNATIIDVSAFRKINVCIGPTKATYFTVSIGKIGGRTFAQGFLQLMDNKIHTYDVIGPQMSLLLMGGPPNSTEKVSLWIYLSS